MNLTTITRSTIVAILMFGSTLLAACSSPEATATTTVATEAATATETSGDASGAIQAPQENLQTRELAMQVTYPELPEIPAGSYVHQDSIPMDSQEFYDRYAATAMKGQQPRTEYGYVIYDVTCDLVESTCSKNGKSVDMGELAMSIDYVRNLDALLPTLACTHICVDEHDRVVGAVQPLMIQYMERYCELKLFQPGYTCDL